MAGETIKVIHPGRWNLEAGPDFLDAVLMIEPGKRVVEGDVEVHIHQSGWHSHHHSDDSRYERVVLHVLWHPPESLTTPAPMTLALQGQLDAQSVSLSAIDTSAYPYRVSAQPHPASSLFQELEVDEVLAILDAAGEERFRRKAQAFAERADACGFEQVVYEDVMTALGYKHNGWPFRCLAQRLTYLQIKDRCGRSVEDAYSLMAGLSGLLPEPSDVLPRESNHFLRSCWDSWWKHRLEQDTPLSRKEWQLGSMRPSNHPLRRLMAAACWFTREPGPFDDLVKRGEGEGPGMLKALCAELTTFPEDAFWKNRLSLKSVSGRRQEALVGAGRAAVIVANVVLPAIIASGKVSDPAEWIRSLPPEPENAVSRELAHAVFGQDYNQTLFADTLRRQGMLQLFQDFFLTGTNETNYNVLRQAIEQFIESKQGCHP